MHSGEGQGGIQEGSRPLSSCGLAKRDDHPHPRREEPRGTGWVAGEGLATGSVHFGFVAEMSCRTGSEAEPHGGCSSNPHPPTVRARVLAQGCSHVKK